MSDTIVRSWVQWYTSALPEDVARDRRDEIASDIYEQRADSTRSATLPILARSIRGMPADLSWRRAQLRATRTTAPELFASHRSNSLAFGVPLAAAVVTVLWGVYVLSRITVNVLAGDIRPFSETAITMIAFTLLAASGTVLYARPRTRTVGCAALGISAIVLLPAGSWALASLSATVGVLTVNIGPWNYAAGAFAAGFALVFLASAVWWLPERSPRERKN